jgi:cation diffusion facilitator CzcD-associated flavoprotein CzcO
MQAEPSVAIDLPRLEARLRQDLEWLELPAKSWVPERRVAGRRVHDVVIVGAGMAGLAASWMLKRLGVANHVLLDRAEAGREGPWITYARMDTLRSPKQLTGPAAGLPALTFRAYYEARFGRPAWDTLGKIPRTLWMEYLVWYRRVLDLPVRNLVSVESVRPFSDDLLEISVAGSGEAPLLARHVVLATGRDGLGGPFVPGFAGTIARDRWAHSADDIDFAALAGRRVAVVGAGASAMDNAATALENGAARVDLLVRRADIPRINKFTGIGSQGVIHGFAGLSDEWKWRFLDYALSAQTPPPRDSVLRVTRHADAHVHLSSPVVAAEMSGNVVLLRTPGKSHLVDFVIFATGFGVDPARRAELADFARHIALWRDIHPEMAADANGELGASPYLGDGFEFTERVPGNCLTLGRLHCFNYPSTLSHGKLSGDIPAISEGADRLARAIARRLFVDDREKHFSSLVAYDMPEILGDEWIPEPV